MDLIQGHCSDRFSSVRSLIADFISTGEELGFSLVVNIKGQDEVDLWGGYADLERSRRWRENTVTNVFSTTKPVTSLAALMLVDRGFLDVHEKVAKYWPEFAANGKQDVEVRHILGHTSGVPGWEQIVTLEDVCDFDKASSLLAAQSPWWTAGTASGYHSFTFGHLVGKLVRCVTGKTLKQFIHDELAIPLHADFQIGLSRNDGERVSDVIPPPASTSTPHAVSEHSTKDNIASRVQGNPNFEASRANSELWRNAELGAANGHGNARSVSRLLSPISRNGLIDGDKQLLSPKTIDLIFEEQSKRIDLVTNEVIRFGIGYGLTGKDTFVDWLPEGRICFWGGFGGSVGIMDLDRQLTITYVMNKMDMVGFGSDRSKAYVKAIYAALGVNE